MGVQGILFKWVSVELGSERRNDERSGDKKAQSERTSMRLWVRQRVGTGGTCQALRGRGRKKGQEACSILWAGLTLDFKWCWNPPKNL